MARHALMRDDETMNDHTDTSWETRATSRLERPRNGRLLAGVAAAIARSTGIDVGLVRLGLVVSSFFGGLGLVAYLAGWALLPEEGQAQSPLERVLGAS